MRCKESIDQIPCVIVSDTADVEKAVAYIKAGAQDFITKNGLYLLPKVIEESSGLTMKHRSKDILRAFFDESSDSLYVKDRQGRYILINKAGAKFIGKPIQEILGKNDTEIFNAEAALFIMKSDREVLMSGETAIVENTLSPLNGPKRYFQAGKEYL